jgi:hypothetical protein
MTGLVDPNKTKGNKIIPMIVSLGLRFQKIQSHLKNTKQKTEKQTEEWILHQLSDQAPPKKIKISNDRYF